MDALRVALWATQYTLGVIDAPKVARKALESFRGRAESWLEESCAEWFPKYVLPEVQAAGRLAVVFDLSVDDGYGYYLVLPAGARLSPKIEAFRSFVLDEMARLHPRGG